MQLCTRMISIAMEACVGAINFEDRMREDKFHDWSSHWRKEAEEESTEIDPAVGKEFAYVSNHLTPDGLSPSRKILDSNAAFHYPANKLVSMLSYHHYHPQCQFVSIFTIPDSTQMRVMSTFQSEGNRSSNLSAIAAGFTKQGDNVWFVCKTNTASTFQATLIQTEQSPPGTVCGIMVRQSRDPIAAFLFVGANKDHVISYRRNSRAKFDYAWAEVPKADRAKPIFLRIQKTGDRLASYYTFEISKPWLPVGPTNEPLSAEVTLSGLVICSGTTSNKVVAKFGGIFEQ